MGFGEVIGNQSVHWRVVHEEHGTPGPPERTRLKGAGPVQGVENLVVQDFEARGADRVPFDRIGQGAAGKGHAGFFRVELRFTSQADADAALAAAKVIDPVPAPGGGAAGGAGQPTPVWVIAIEVPANNRTPANVGPPADPPAEVRIDW
jgi:hypothetical protein